MGAYETSRLGTGPGGICNGLMPSVAQSVVGRCMPLQSWGDDSEPAAGASPCGFVLAVRFKPLVWLKMPRNLNPGVGSGGSVQSVCKASKPDSGRCVVFQTSPHALLTRCPQGRQAVRDFGAICSDRVGTKKSRRV